MRAAVRRKASVLVEFALVAPVLVMLILLMIQYGIIMNRMLTLSHAAREAARHAAVRPEEDEPIREKARGAVRGRGYRPERMNIVIEPAQGSPLVFGARQPTGTILFRSSHGFPEQTN